MTKNTTPEFVSTAAIRAAFHKGDLDATKVVALNAKGEPKTDKDGKPVIANPACLFGGPQGRGRGRLNPAFVKAFLDANPGKAYAEKTVKSSPVKMVTLPLTKMNAAGARMKRPEALPLSEVRAAAGVPDKKGRLSAAEVEKATAVIVAARGWDKAPAKAVKAAKPVADKKVSLTKEAPASE